MKALLRWFSYLFHLAFGLFWLGTAALALIFVPRALQVKMLPWEGVPLDSAILAAALFGVTAAWWAITDRRRMPFFVWSLALAVFLVKGFLFGGSRFAPGEAALAAELMAASWLALAGAWLTLRQPARRRR